MQPRARGSIKKTCTYFTAKQSRRSSCRCSKHSSSQSSNDFLGRHERHQYVSLLCGPVFIQDERSYRNPESMHFCHLKYIWRTNNDVLNIPVFENDHVCQVYWQTPDRCYHVVSTGAAWVDGSAVSLWDIRDDRKPRLGPPPPPPPNK